MQYTGPFFLSKLNDWFVSHLLIYWLHWNYYNLSRIYVLSLAYIVDCTKKPHNPMNENYRRLQEQYCF